MTPQHPHASLYFPISSLFSFPAVYSPDTNGTVVGGGGEEGRVGGEAQVRDACGVGMEGSVEGERREGVDVDG